MLLDALAGYRPLSDVEAADLERIRALAAAGDPWRRSSPLHVTVSAIVVHPPTARILLRWHAREQAWLHIGGHADPGETDPLAIALREGSEETGLDDLVPWPDAAVVHVVVVPVTATAGEAAHEHADVRFVLATGRPEQARPEKPGADLRWLSIEESYAATREANLRETLARVELLLRPDAGGVRSRAGDDQQPIREMPSATSSNQSVSEPSP
jgi:8-oxo-dGTP pyrophosphatase MutT (NUDIX family)